MRGTKASLIQPAIDSLLAELAGLEQRREVNLPNTPHRKQRRVDIENLEELLADEKIGDRAKVALEPALTGFKAAEESNDRELHEVEAKIAEAQEKIKELEELLARHS